jgi:hypothetical protein
MADVVSVLAQASTPSSWVDAPLSLAVPDSDAAARLTGLLSTQATQAKQVEGPAALNVTAPTSSAPVASVSGSKSMGDKILQSLDSIGRTFKEKNIEFDKILNADTVELSSRQMLQLQAHMSDHSIMVDLASKLVGKFVQEVDQIVRTP